MYEENFPSNTDELPICPSRASWALSANRIDWVCPYEVDTRLFDFAEAVFQPFLPKLDDTENQVILDIIKGSSIPGPVQCNKQQSAWSMDIRIRQPVLHVIQIPEPSGDDEPPGLDPFRLRNTLGNRASLQPSLQ